MRTTHFSFHFGYILLISLLIIGCDKVEPMQISNDVFSLELWSDWKYQRGQGIDTYTGIFTNGNEEIMFDVGSFAFSDIANIQPTPETTYYEETIIDNLPAKIIKTQNGNSAILKVYIENAATQQRAIVFVHNPINDERYITIFRSLRFL